MKWSSTSHTAFLALDRGPGAACLNLRVFNKYSAVVRKGVLKEEKNDDREAEWSTRQESVKQLCNTKLTLHPHHSWRALLPLDQGAHVPQTQGFGYLSFLGKRILAESEAQLKKWQCLSREHQSSPPGV